MFKILFQRLFLFSVLIFISAKCQSQQPRRDKAVFREYEKGYYENNILKDLHDNEAVKPAAARKKFVLDFSEIPVPSSPDEFTKQWHNLPLSQGRTGTCWCFSAISFFESEVKRISGKEVKLSEMYIVYWEYVERVKDFIHTKGKTYFAEGSESNAVPKIMKLYGVVRAADYSGMKKGQTIFDHRKMVEEMKIYLGSVKNKSNWNENEVTATIKSILNEYMGSPPETIKVGDKQFTPKEYLDELRIIPNDYYSFMSESDLEFNEKCELTEDDNWRHSRDYYNISLSKFAKLIDDAIKSGYTISLCGDVSEPGFDKYLQAAVVPSFDIPAEYIDDKARLSRWHDKSTTDDHCVHLVGYTEKDGKKYYLVKDSGAGAFDGKNKGYFYLHEDYVKLKMLNVLMHKDAAREVLDKIIK